MILLNLGFLLLQLGFFLALELPFLNCALLHLCASTIQFTLFNIAYAFLSLAEAPIIMLNMLTMVFVKNKNDFKQVFKFAIGLIIIVFALLVIFDFANGVNFAFNLKTNSANNHLLFLYAIITALALAYKRIFQGILLLHGRYRSVLIINIVRFSLVVTSVLLLHFLFTDYATMAIFCLMLSFFIEASITHMIARGDLSKLPEKNSNEKVISHRELFKFFYPMMLTGSISLIFYPLLNFFFVHSTAKLFEVAAFQLAFSFISPFRNMAMSLQELIVPILRNDIKQINKIRNYILYISGTMLCILCAVYGVMEYLSLNHSINYSEYTNNIFRTTFLVLILYPITTILIVWKRSVMICVRNTKPFLSASITELLMVGIICFIFINNITISAPIAIVVGRLSSILYLYITSEK